MEIKNLCKSYKKGNEEIEIFKNLNVKFEKGKFYIITGESGSGKTTLINILAMLENFDRGVYTIDGERVENLSDKEESLLRFKKIGIIFQDYYLNERLTAYENVLIAGILDKSKSKEQLNQDIDKLLKKVKVEKRKKHYPKEMSGGECQRVCIARALVNSPSYILADEPTGSLDEKNTKIIMEILKRLVSEDKCVIMSTHDKKLIQYADVHYSIENNRIKKVK